MKTNNYNTNLFTSIIIKLNQILVISESTSIVVMSMGIPEKK